MSKNVIGVVQGLGNMEMKVMPQGAPYILGKHQDLQYCMQSHDGVQPTALWEHRWCNLRVPGGLQEKMVIEMSPKGLGMGRFVSNIYGENKDKKKLQHVG